MHNEDHSVSREAALDIYTPDMSSPASLPYADEGVQAGFPSPAQDYITQTIDLNREIVRHPMATFFARVRGESMRDEGINDGDLLVIDRALDPGDGDLVVCCLDNEFTLKRIKIEPGRIWLVAANESYDPILVTEDQEFSVWGVVTYTIKHFKRRKVVAKKTAQRNSDKR
ncbi:MAG: LexA family protein [Muribaculaceae bacterium]